MSKAQLNASDKVGKGGIFIIIGGVAAIVIIGVLVGVIVYLLNPEEEQQEKRNVVVTPDNVEEVVDNMISAEFVEPGYFETSMTNIWHFSDGAAVSEDAYVQNVVGNTNDIYFDVVLADDEEHFIYKSPVIPRGSSLEQIALDEDLDAGTYDCVMIYHLVDEDQNTISTLRIGITVIVEN